MSRQCIKEEGVCRGGVNTSILFYSYGPYWASAPSWIKLLRNFMSIPRFPPFSASAPCFYSSRTVPVQFTYSTRTVPVVNSHSSRTYRIARRPQVGEQLKSSVFSYMKHIALTVPLQCPYSALMVFTQCPYHLNDWKRRSRGPLPCLLRM